MIYGQQNITSKSFKQLDYPGFPMLEDVIDMMRAECINHGAGEELVWITDLDKNFLWQDDVAIERYKAAHTHQADMVDQVVNSGRFPF